MERESCQRKAPEADSGSLRAQHNARTPLELPFNAIRGHCLALPGFFLASYGEKIPIWLIRHDLFAKLHENTGVDTLHSNCWDILLSGKNS